MSKLIFGGYSVGVPPLPIPNREVKPVRADGTASSGRVGRRHFSERFFRILKNLFFYVFNINLLENLLIYPWSPTMVSSYCNTKNTNSDS